MYIASWAVPASGVFTYSAVNALDVNLLTRLGPPADAVLLFAGASKKGDPLRPQPLGFFCGDESGVGVGMRRERICVTVGRGSGARRGGAEGDAVGAKGQRPERPR